MAKEKEKKTAAKGEQIVASEENVMETIRKGNLIDEEIAAIGDEQDDKEEQERKVREYRRAKNKAKYQNYKALLQLRARRREEKATKEWLSATKTLFDELCGSKCTPTEYEEKRREAYKECEKAIQESNSQLNKEISELQRQFPGYWCYEWDRY